MDDVKKRAKLYLFKFDKCASQEQIMETIQAAMQFARTNDVNYIEISMKYDGGSWYANGAVNPEE